MWNELLRRRKQKLAGRRIQLLRRISDKTLGVVDKPVVDGVQRELQAIRDAQLVEDVVQVIFYRLLGNKKFLADFLVAEALRHQLDNLFFAIAQQRLFAA